jgi:hypothetical protein
LFVVCLVSFVEFVELALPDVLPELSAGGIIVAGVFVGMTEKVLR